ncbi:MAG: D-proline reductase (dithiol) proprotein PrdA [Clostridiales Family XIII bacterium]|jgi:D-proline reductase (dithiol) PrdA|nr:D-proline reductase (dithiol) proprotein PrdA [Clostridiales Family XIII bacterium]
MSKEKAMAYLNEPAVLCCQRGKGTVISEADLEDPTIFADLQDSGLLSIPDGSLTVGDVLGMTLNADVEALTALRPSMLEGGAAKPAPSAAAGGAAPGSVTACGAAAPAAPAPATPGFGAAAGTAHFDAPPALPGGPVTIHVDSLQGLDISFPAGWPALYGLCGAVPGAEAPVAAASGTAAGGAASVPGASGAAGFSAASALGASGAAGFSAAAALGAAAGLAAHTAPAANPLTHKYYSVQNVKLGKKTSFSSGTLTIDSALTEKALSSSPLVKQVEMDIITPEKRHIFTNTIMDIMPVAVKCSGKTGEGTTAILDRVVFCLTGLDEKGVQIHEFGSCEGYLDEKAAFGRPGAPDDDDIIVRVNVTIQENTGMERRGPLAAHTACDVIVQSIRDVLKATDEAPAFTKTYHDTRRRGLPRVCLVKEIMGQGAMHDNILLPNEPAGVIGGQKNVDLGNVPVMLTPNEVLDGGIHALTCIGPATKETTRHYFREPLVHALAADEEIDFIGVIFVGSPQVNDEKMYVTERLGSWIGSLDLDGAIVTTEGFGNNHIDFAGHIAAIGGRNVPVVGVTFSAYQGQLVVGNEYMDAMIEINKDAGGFENEVLACSSICPEDASRAQLMLKTKMAGIPIAPAERKWSQAVIDGNQWLADQA